MITFQVTDMTCGHCASAITRAIASVDDKARLDIRIQQKLVRITSSASAEQLAQAIEGAGYTARAIEESAAASALAAGAAPKKGCGCGTRKPAAPSSACATGAGATRPVHQELACECRTA